MATMLTMKCKQCNKEFQFPYADRYERKYCGQKCAKLALRGERIPSVRIHVTCEICDKPIWYHRSQPHRRFCSQQCASIGERTRFEINCRWCDKPFEVTPTEYKNGYRLCSWDCRVAEGDDAKNRICEICNKPFRVKARSILTRTCSPTCTHELRKRGKYMTCEICNKKKWITPVHFDTFRFCSRKCRGIWQKERMNGSNHPNWQGGTSKLPYPFEWTDELRTQIKDRDGDKCMECDTTKNLTVHHIDYDKSNCNPLNLITLCNTCNPRANFNRSYWQPRYEEIVISIILTPLAPTSIPLRSPRSPS